LLQAASPETFGYTLIHGINDVIQTEMHTAEPLVLEFSCFKDEIAIEELLIKFWQN